MVEAKDPKKKKSGIDQLTSLKQMKENFQRDERIAGSHDESLQSGTTEEEINTKVEGVKGIEEEEREILIPEEQENIAVDLEESESADFNEMFEDVESAELEFEEELEEEFIENENSNDIILELYQNGDSIIEIAKQLGLGVGEVKLVIDLYRGEEK